MKLTKYILLMVVGLAAAACTDAGRFGADGSDDGGTAGAGAGGAFAPGSANDPSSTAYFNQTVGDRVLFAVDQSTISDTGRLTLDGQAAWLLENTDFTAVIEGHADEQGTREYNVALGAR
ncbi:MAG: peptidoglycan-associated lipoprotein, partial [Paracoccaceae bacterium]